MVLLLVRVKHGVMMFEHWKSIFFLCEFVKSRRKTKRKKKKKRKENEANYIQPAILTSCLVNRGFTIYGLKDENQRLRDQRGKSRGAVPFSLGHSPSEHSICYILPAREFSRIIRSNKQNITALKLSS